MNSWRSLFLRLSIVIENDYKLEIVPKVIKGLLILYQIITSKCFFSYFCMALKIVICLKN